MMERAVTDSWNLIWPPYNQTHIKKFQNVFKKEKQQQHKPRQINKQIWSKCNQTRKSEKLPKPVTRKLSGCWRLRASHNTTQRLWKHTVWLQSQHFRAWGRRTTTNPRLAWAMKPCPQKVKKKIKQNKQKALCVHADVWMCDQRQTALNPQFFVLVLLC